MNRLEGASMETGDLLAVNLHALAGSLYNEYPAFVVHFHRDRPVEMLLSFHKTLSPIPGSQHSWVQLQPLPAPLRQSGVAGEFGDEAAISAKHLEPVILEISNVDDSIPVDCDTTRPVELSIAFSGRTELHQEIAFPVEFLYSVIPPVGYKHVAVVIDLYAPGIAEFSIPISLAAP